jgi:hypothetical protein
MITIIHRTLRFIVQFILFYGWTIVASPKGSAIGLVVLYLLFAHTTWYLPVYVAFNTVFYVYYLLSSELRSTLTSIINLQKDIYYHGKEETSNSH